MASKLFDLTGQVCLVTGGNGGIGLGMAEGMAMQGADVVIWGRNVEKNKAAKARLEKAGGKVATAKVDVADEAAVRQGIIDIVNEFGRLDTAIANAGMSTSQASVFDIDTEQFDRVMQVNVNGVLYTLRESARHMVERAEVAGCEILHNHAVIDTAGARGLTSVTIAPLDVNGDAVPQSERRIDCDLLCVSGGFTPSVHLYSQADGKLDFREDIQSLVPKSAIPGLEIVGAARGDFGPPAAPALSLSRGRWKQFVDLQNDVTAADVELAARDTMGAVIGEVVRRTDAVIEASA